MSIADLSVSAPNCVGAMTPVFSAACLTRRATRCFSIWPEIDSNDIGHYYWGDDASLFGLGITTHVEYFLAIAWWLCVMEAFKSCVRSRGWVLYVVARTLLIILSCLGPACGLLT